MCNVLFIYILKCERCADGHRFGPRGRRSVIDVVSMETRCVSFPLKSPNEWEENEEEERNAGAKTTLNS